MRLGADEISRMKKARDRGYEGCYKYIFWRDNTTICCPDVLCNKIIDVCRGREKNEPYISPHLCPCDAFSKNDINNAVTKMIEWYERRPQ